MDFIKSITELFKPSNINKTSIPEGFCPTCWGRQEYGGKFYDAVYKEGINLNNISSKKGWITAYVQQNLEGIKLKEGAKKCATCATA